MARPSNATIRMRKAWSTRRKKYGDGGFKKGHAPTGKKLTFFQKLLRKI